MRRLANALAPIGWTIAVLVPVAYLVLYFVEGRYGIPLSEESFRFARPWAGLLALGAALAIAARGYVSPSLAPRLSLSRARDVAAVARRSPKAIAKHLPTALRAVALGLLALGLMGPQSIHARDTADVDGIDIVLVLDLSLSMQAADIRPNRFDAAKDVVDQFIRRRPNDRIGAVIFGREAYTLMPLTTDKEALRTAISELELNMIDGRGTAIGNAVATGLNRLRRSEAESRVVILLTDGDSNAGNVSPEQAADFARSLSHPLGETGPDGRRRAGVKIYTVLMGASEDARVQQGTDIFGRPVWDRGNFPINPELLERMAETTGGESFRATDRAGLERSFHSILDRLERSRIEDPGRVYGELYPAFVWPGFVLLLIELLLSSLWLRRWP